MSRIVIENIFFFMLPTVAYIAWVAFKDDEWAGIGAVLRRAPLLRLFVAGAALMLATLVTFSSRSHNNPQDVYVPPSVQDGKLTPGHTIHEPPAKAQDN
ncbi:hypothetical protein DLM45_11860 [Hyphomicrobium methylovorum]|uniref:DUF6111 family protein n=1 Tax=Hyphomicrobium methylovorum TaxID=84 RepID=UPI0015E785F2|nr:DUF6111 family protein [Hyphomicrobium methylovorum]MBA2126909.1 hypothetical protein [Hyphomicrobium methylovorum]